MLIKNFDDPDDDDDDDDDEQHHWYIVKMLNHNVLHNIAFLTSLQELNRYWMISMYYHRIVRFLINMKVQGQHPHPLPGSWLAARMADSRYVYHESFHSLQFLCHLRPCHLGPPRPMLSINLYVKGCLDCTIGVFHIYTSGAFSPSE